jgi:hypothetical protein
MIFPSSRETNLFCKLIVVPLLLLIGDKVPVKLLKKKKRKEKKKLLKVVVFVGCALQGRDIVMHPEMG